MPRTTAAGAEKMSLQSAFRLGTELCFGRRRAHAADEVRDRLDRGIPPPEPAAVERGSAPCIQPRQHGHHGNQRNRINPGCGPCHGERPQERKRECEPDGQGHNRQQQPEPSLHEQVEELEPVLVVSRDEHEHERQRLRCHFKDRSERRDRPGVARERHHHQQQNEEREHAREEQEDRAPGVTSMRS